jgi:hypothetical protein
LISATHIRFDSDHETVAIAFISTINNKKMITPTNSLNKQLFTELTPAESATVIGGATECFTSNIIFIDPRIFPPSRSFKVSPGGDIQLSTSTTSSNSSNKKFNAILVNSNGQREDFDRILQVGKDTTYWNNVKGGNYTIKFTDEAYNSEIDGQAKICYG